MTAAERLEAQLSELQKALQHARGSLARSQANVRSGYKGAQAEELEDFACIRELQSQIAKIEPLYLEARNTERARRNAQAEADRERREQNSQAIRDKQQMAWMALNSVVKAEQASKELAELKTRALTAVSQLPKAEQKQYRVRLSELG
jgi:hypothetical protein